MPLALLAVAIGITILWRAADEFVTGAARLAVVYRVSPVLVGAVIIGFGTSAPEMLVSAIAASGGNSDVGIGNIIGSNIANLSLVLGAAALMLPIGIKSGVLKQEGPFSTGAAILFAFFVIGGINPVEGIILLVALAVALGLMMRSGGNEAMAEELSELTSEPDVSVNTEIGRTLAGLAATVGGAWVLVWGALRLADQLGLSGGFIGVTLVALGTSLPELVTTIAAARKGEVELIVGNLLGSNLFNSLAVGGLVGLIGDGTITDPSLTGSDLVFMLIVSVGTFIAMKTRRVFTRTEGVFFLGVFVVFLVVTYLGEINTVPSALLVHQ